jgi:putative salt-induced outer membrane protein YdiY
MTRKTIPFLLLAGAVFACPAAADQVLLKNGDRLSGSVSRFDGKVLVLETGHSGTLRLPAGQIAGIGTDGPVTVHIKGIGWTTGRLVTDYAGAFRVMRQGRPLTGPVVMDDVTRMEAGREIPRGFQWRGQLNVGMTEHSGNIDSRALHVDGESTGRSEEDRIRVRGEFNSEFNSDRRTTDNFLTSLQHDHFVSEKVFFYTSGKLERDTPADLRLRTTVGTGAGYQILETPETKLSFDAGPAYIHEDHDMAPDNDYVALQWGVEFEQDIWKGFATLFHNHEGTVEANNARNLFIDSSTGLRVPLRENLNVTARFDLDWDRDPPPGTTTLEKTYLLTIGYSW